jgi:hypothetical protein
MRRSPLFLVLGIATCLAMSAASPAVGATPTTVNGLTATVSGTTITLGGTATFGGQDAVLVGDDPANDNLGGAQTAAIGTDLDRMLISQPNPADPTLQFTIDLGGLSGGGIPEHIAYNWDIRVDGGEAKGGADLSIKSWRTRAASGGGLDPYAAVFTCVPSATGGSTCTPGPTLSVTYNETASEIQLTVPLAVISAKPGSEITAWNRISAPVWTGGTFGTQTFAGLYDTSTHDPYMVPKREVKLGIAPAGSPISYASAATLTGSSFGGGLTAPGPGTYDVGAQACFGGNCATLTRTVTVT